MADDTTGARRSQRPRSGLAICDEALLFALHRELMQKEEPNSKRKAERRKSDAGVAVGSGVQAQADGQPRATTGGGTLANGGASGSGDAFDDRAAKRPKGAVGAELSREGSLGDYIDAAAGQPTAWAVSNNTIPLFLLVNI